METIITNLPLPTQTLKTDIMEIVGSVIQIMMTMTGGITTINTAEVAITTTMITMTEEVITMITMGITDVMKDGRKIIIAMGTAIAAVTKVTTILTNSWTKNNTRLR